MFGELEKLEVAARDFELEADDDFVDPGRLAAVIDRLKGKLCRVAYASQKRGDHILKAQSPVTFVSVNCQMSRTSAADHLCVGEQLAAMPRLGEALSSGQVGYQAASVICHLQKRLGDVDAHLDEEMWIGFARRFSIKDLGDMASRTWHAVDPEGFCQEVEDKYERRQLFISEMDGMYRLDGWLDPEAGAALQTAIQSLAKRLGQDDSRTPKQRRADALTELVHHAMDQGTLPRRNGVRPHITVITTIEGLKAELGAEASELESGMPISSKTVQRLACDGTLSRVLKADSMVVDVGRATRATSPAQSRALKARYRTCAGPGCDRPMNWTSTHHIEFWSHGGQNNLPEMLPLCYYHHRLVHEGGWQVVKAAGGVKFIPPDREIARRARGPGMDWAA
jgi:hypothetical protein